MLPGMIHTLRPPPCTPPPARSVVTGSWVSYFLESVHRLLNLCIVLIIYIYIDIIIYNIYVGFAKLLFTETNLYNIIS